MSTKLDFESYAIVATSRRGGRERPGQWAVAHRSGAVITHTDLGPMDLDEAKAKAAAMFPERDIFGPEDRKPWE